MNQTVLATLESAAVAFGAGCISALQPFFATGVMPPQPQWGTIIATALAAGIASVYLRFRPAPSQGPTLTTTSLSTPTASTETTTVKP
jgi:ABC-type dipeptide/oligopeptide/nickel transport system permease subunit